jgi:predicted nucleic acid-binding protein
VIVVLDSGIWISALQFGGTPLAALERALTEHRVGICDQIEEEVVQVLWKKFGWEISRIEESLGMYLQDAIRVAVPGTLHGVCRDAKDDMVVECAVNAGGDLIVSRPQDARNCLLARADRAALLTAASVFAGPAIVNQQ